MLSLQRWSNNDAGQYAIPADGGIAFICFCVFVENALACPPTAAGKRVTLEIGLECCLCDDGQTMMQALPACPPTAGK